MRDVEGHACILVLGNTGSGKTTLARALADRRDLRHLDLDTVVWDPVQVTVARSDDAIRSDLDAFVDAHPRWVIEGCYGDWAQHLSPAASLLVFLNPGVERCLANQASRPWEPHKYDDPAEQERRRDFLRAWTMRYPERDDGFGLTCHRRVFEGFVGAKVEVGVDGDAIEDVEALSRP